MPNYLIRPYRKYYAVLDVPKALRKQLGVSRFKAPLDTESRSVAERRALVHVARWKKEIEDARRGGDDPIEDEIRYWRKAFMKVKGDDEGENAIKDIVIDHYAEKMEQREPGSGVAFLKRITGEVVSLTEHLEEWLRTLPDEAKTIDLKRGTVERFSDECPTVEDVTRKKVQKWARRRVLEEGRSTATVRRALSELRGYWRYLQSNEVVSDDLLPFDHIDVPKASKKEAVKQQRRAFEPGTVVALVQAAEARKDAQLADLIRLGMWTGARIEELCSLKTSNVTDEYFSIEDAKTEAGWRQVPIHSKLKPTMKRLLKASKDGYLLSGLSDKGKYGDRSTAIGKRFGRLKTAQGFNGQYVFHSIRKTVATLLENAGVPEGVAADIIGHEKPTMTYGLYSGGATLEVKREALEKIDYPCS